MKARVIDVPVTMTVDLTVNGEPVPWEPFVAERDDLRAELAAERAHADRLAMALASEERVHQCDSIATAEALAAHAARRREHQG